MKNKFALIALLGLFLSGTYTVYAQEKTDSITEEYVPTVAGDTEAETTISLENVRGCMDAAAVNYDETATIEDNGTCEFSFRQIIKQKFIDGGPGFMGIVLLCLILGLALAIERIIYLNMATTNTEKLLNDVEGALKSGGVEDAQEVCRNTKGPVASIFYQGLERSDEGVEMVEKSIIAYGSVQMGVLEKGLSWISLFISLAPMLGFMGTVIGMIDAFDSIEAENNISPALVAGGIKIALLTTVFGLIVAMILQIFYNYLISKVDSIVNDMEDASISLIDLLIEAKTIKK